MIPAKIQSGDEIRVVSPATSLACIPEDVRQIAHETLQSLGFEVTYGKNAAECGLFNSSTVASRLEDLHQAFADPQVRGILTTLGGYNSNQLLQGLDYELIRANPKVFCGYSDITALSNAIYAKTGLVTYSGPHFSTFGMRRGLDYTLTMFRHCLMQDVPFPVLPSDQWSDDPWYLDQVNRTFESNPGFLILNEGQAEGTLIGGNLCTLNLLQGTAFMPSMAGRIVLVEDDDESQPLTIDRDLQSLLHQPGFEGVRGLVIGRFQRGSHMTQEMLTHIIRSKPELAKIPVLADVDFGHTTPQLTLPVGGSGRLVVEKDRASFTVLEH